MKRFILAHILALSPFLLVADGSGIPPTPNYEHRFNFGLLNLGYERILPDSVYTGFDVRMASILNTTDNKVKSVDHYVNGELRIGYNHQIGDMDRITPYTGIGFSVFSIEKEQGKLKNWNYGTIGAKYLHRFGNTFEMGMHLKGYLSISAKRYESKKEESESVSLPYILEEEGKIPRIAFSNENNHGKNTLTAVKVNETRWLTEIGIPLIWHVGDQKNWEIMIEPYYMQMPNEKLTHIIGSRAEIGYHF